MKSPIQNFRVQKADQFELENLTRSALERIGERESQAGYSVCCYTMPAHTDNPLLRGIPDYSLSFPKV